MISPRAAILSVAAGWFVGWQLRLDPDNRKAFWIAVAITAGIVATISVVVADRWDFWNGF